MYKIKNQNELPWAKADCTIYSIVTILELTYWITIPSRIAEKLSIKAQQEGVLFADDGANFNIIYNWACDVISEEIGLNIIVEKLNINSDLFKMKVNDWYYYWLGLQHGNNRYLDHVDCWFIKNIDINEIISNPRKWQHNHCFGKCLNDFDTTYTSIIEIARWKEINCSFDTLKYWIDKGVWWSPARTFIGWDILSMRALQYLRQIHFDPESEIVINSDLDQEALNKASSINKEWKVDFKYWNK